MFPARDLWVTALLVNFILILIFPWKNKWKKFILDLGTYLIPLNIIIRQIPDASKKFEAVIEEIPISFSSELPIKTHSDFQLKPII